MHRDAWAVPPMWRGRTVVILAGGPSLTADQVEHVRQAQAADACQVLAINNSLWLAPWADAHWFCDRRWWDWHQDEVRAFGGVKLTLENYDLAELGVHGVHNMGAVGFCPDPRGVYTGKNSGYQCIHVAAHAQAARVLLLGYDMRIVEGRTHWHAGHGRPLGPKVYSQIMLPHFEALRAPLEARGVEVINCTPGSALDVWPRGRIEDCLEHPARPVRRPAA